MYLVALLHGVGAMLLAGQGSYEYAFTLTESREVVSFFDYRLPAFVEVFTAWLHASASPLDLRDLVLQAQPDLVSARYRKPVPRKPAQQNPSSGREKGRQ
jgi:hypothetical protein